MQMQQLRYFLEIAKEKNISAAAKNLYLSQPSLSQQMKKLEEELEECLFCLKRNEMMFDLEVDTDLIEQRIYERQALLCRYRYLLARARELGLHTVLTKYQPQI